MIKLKSKVSKDIYEIIKVNENHEEYGDIYVDNFERFKICKPEKIDILSEIEREDKPEKLTERYELRLTKTEKKIITALNQKGINVSEMMRDFIISLDEQIARELNQIKYEQLQKKYDEVLAELDKMYKLKNEYQFLRGETQEEAQTLTNLRANIKKTLEILESQKGKIKSYLEKYEVVFRSSEHRNG